MLHALRPLQQTIPHRNLQPKPRRLTELPNPASQQRRDQQAKTRDGYRKRIHIHAIHRIQSPLHQFPFHNGRGDAAPLVEQSMKRTQQKMTRTTSRINQPHIVETEFFQCRLQRAI